MAKLTVRDSDTVLTDPSEVGAFCADHGLGYEVWNIDKLAAADQGADESDEDFVLRVFSDEVQQLKDEGGYTTADVIALSPETPNLDELLAKFDKEHEHTEDEVRFVVDGRGVFTIHADQGDEDVTFDVEVHPGDLLVVPEGTYHWFDLCDDKTIKCIRVFETKEGWVAHYRDDA